MLVVIYFIYQTEASEIVDHIEDAIVSWSGHTQSLDDMESTRVQIVRASGGTNVSFAILKLPGAEKEKCCLYHMNSLLDLRVVGTSIGAKAEKGISPKFTRLHMLIAALSQVNRETLLDNNLSGESNKLIYYPASTTYDCGPVRLNLAVTGQSWYANGYIGINTPAGSSQDPAAIVYCAIFSSILLSQETITHPRSIPIVKSNAEWM